MTTDTSGGGKKQLHTLYNKLADLDETRRNCDKERMGVEEKWNGRNENGDKNGKRGQVRPSIEQRAVEIDRWVELQRKSYRLKNIISDKLEEIEEAERSLTHKEKSSLLKSLKLD